LRELAASETFTDATDGGVPVELPDTTVILALPVRDPLDAVITAVPGATPVMRPVADTVATAELLELHVTVR
jgi:hypothetical protein